MAQQRIRLVMTEPDGRRYNLGKASLSATGESVIVTWQPTKTKATYHPDGAKFVGGPWGMGQPRKREQVVPLSNITQQELFTAEIPSDVTQNAPLFRGTSGNCLEVSSTVAQSPNAQIAFELVTDGDLRDVVARYESDNRVLSASTWRNMAANRSLVVAVTHFR
jgi:hypothetical protein